MGMELPTVIATKGDGRRAMQWQRSGGGATEKHVVVQILRKIPSLRKTISVSLLWKNFSIRLMENVFRSRRSVFLHKKKIFLRKTFPIRHFSYYGKHFP